MHYKNGREAKNGDKVVLLPSHGPPIVGILYDAVAGNDYCNGRIAPTLPNDPYPNLKECLHIDDALGMIAYAEQRMARITQETPQVAAETDPPPPDIPPGGPDGNG